MSKSQRSRKPPKPVSDWRSMPDEALMQIRVRDLGLRIEDSPLEGCIQQLHAELEAHGLCFRPPCYLADEWFCPDGVPTIAIPFCLADPRLKNIEQKMMYEVEGGTHADCMRLLRHECGHAVNYAYRLHRRTRWRELFGQFTTRYASNYSYQPYSKRYVIHLANNYAQAHPDEDFAETFAVWLTPDSDWQERYADWPVIRKLRYVEGVMARVGAQPPLSTEYKTPWSAARMTSTLEAHYERKRRLLGDEFAGSYDAALQRIFSTTQRHGETIPAAKLLRRHRRQLISSATTWTGRRKYDLHQLVSKMTRRCDALGLLSGSSETQDLIELAALITAIAGQGPSFRTRSETR